jgi:hypothetical protein
MVILIIMNNTTMMRHPSPTHISIAFAINRVFYISEISFWITFTTKKMNTSLRGITLKYNYDCHEEACAALTRICRHYTTTLNVR